MRLTLAGASIVAVAMAEPARGRERRGLQEVEPADHAEDDEEHRVADVVPEGDFEDGQQAARDGEDRDA